MEQEQHGLRVAPQVLTVEDVAEAMADLGSVGEARRSVALPSTFRRAGGRRRAAARRRRFGIERRGQSGEGEDVRFRGGAPPPCGGLGDAVPQICRGSRRGGGGGTGRPRQIERRDRHATSQYHRGGCGGRRHGRGRHGVAGSSIASSSIARRSAAPDAAHQVHLGGPPSSVAGIEEGRGQVDDGRCREYARPAAGAASVITRRQNRRGIHDAEPRLPGESEQEGVVPGPAGSSTAVVAVAVATGAILPGTAHDDVEADDAAGQIVVRAGQDEPAGGGVQGVDAQGGGVGRHEVGQDVLLIIVICTTSSSTRIVATTTTTTSSAGTGHRQVRPRRQLGAEGGEGRDVRRVDRPGGGAAALGFGHALCNVVLCFWYCQIRSATNAKASGGRRQ